MASKKKQKEQELNWKQSVIVYLHDWICLLMVIFLVFLFFLRVIVVSGDSMYPTFRDGDYLLLLSIAALFFGGQYEGMGVTAFVILGGCLAVVLLGLKGEQKGNLKISKMMPR